jgi:hypothetical protein
VPFGGGDVAGERSSSESDELAEEGFGKGRRRRGRKRGRGRKVEQERDDLESNGEVVVGFVFVGSEEGRDELEKG